MTNKELQNKFVEINLNTDNVFDKFLALSKLEKDYRTTEFYKQTKKSINEAFELYLEKEGRFDTFLALLNDDERLYKVLTKVSEYFSMDNVMNMMDTDNKELFKQLLPYINK